MKKIIVSLVVLLTLSFGNTIDEAQAYYEKGDYASALNIFENLAYKNDAKAQNALGFIYEKEGEYIKAAFWYEKAAVQGCSFSN